MDNINQEKVGTAARVLRSQATAAKKNNERTRSPIRSDQMDSDSESSRASSRRRGNVLPKRRDAEIARARASLKEAQEEAKEEAYNKFLRDRVCRTRVSEPVLEPAESNDSSKLSLEELRAAAGQNVANLVQVATKSGHVKADLSKRIINSAAALQQLVDAMASRTEDEETRRLRTDNNRLRQEVEILKVELKAHRREFSEMRTSMSAANAASNNLPSVDHMEKLRASIVASVGAMLDARFAGIEERLLPAKMHRPPLAADRRMQSSPVTHLTATPATSPATPVATNSAAAETTQVNDWATVVRKGRKGKKTPVTANAAATASTADLAAKPTQPARLRLTPPKTAAVVVTLQPEAAEKGVTYAQILERAERCVNLQELGIGEGVRIRRAATGARLLELPKSQTPEQAELLASRLRTALDGLASVVRPTKSASLRVIGLDDSVTKEKVAAAIARAGNCPVQSVKVGEVLAGPRGIGTVTVHCPIEVAKLLSDAGRVLVGWSSAEVRVLEQRPLRCFRCLGIGHTRPVCFSPIDRGDLCFRCGCSGHKSSGCTSQMRCAVCADAGLPSEHVMGGRICNPPLTKGRTLSSGQTATNAEGRRDQEEADMSS